MIVPPLMSARLSRTPSQLDRRPQRESRSVVAPFLARGAVESLDQPASDVDADRGDQHADRERNAPSPFVQARLESANASRKPMSPLARAPRFWLANCQLAKNMRRSWRRGLEQEHRRRPDFAADREALTAGARRISRIGAQDADRRIAGRRRDHAAADRHQRRSRGSSPACARRGRRRRRSARRRAAAR